MSNQKIFVIGNDDMIILFGLIGIDGIIVNNQEDFLPTFEDLISNLSIGMVIIALDLTEDLISYLLNFKLNNKRPLIYILPNLLDKEEKEEVFLKKYEDILEPFTRRQKVMQLSSRKI